MRTKKTLPPSISNLTKHRRAKQGILCLDLGTSTGYALGTLQGKIIRSGSIELASTKELRHQRENHGERIFDLRVQRLWEWIRKMHKECPLHAIVFEDVNFFTSTSQVQVWCGLRGAIWAFRLAKPGTQLVPVPVGTLKKFACGHGHAKKPAMRAAWLLHHGGTESQALPDEHEVDALWLFTFFQQFAKKADNKKTC